MMFGGQGCEKVVIWCGYEIGVGVFQWYQFIFGFGDDGQWCFYVVQCWFCICCCYFKKIVGGFVYDFFDSGGVYGVVCVYQNKI